MTGLLPGPVSLSAVRRTPFLFLGLIACSNSSEPPGGGTPIDCDGRPVASTGVGEGSLVSVTQSGGCIRLATPTSDAEYLLIAFSANGEEQAGGVSGDFELFVGPDTFSTAIRAAGKSSPPTDPQSRLDATLRRRERAIGTTLSLRSASRPHSAPVIEGDQRSFQVCADLNCGSFVTVASTAQYVGSHGVVFLDDEVPAGGYSEADVDSVGALFDQFLYPIDTTAFGRESDVDGNGQVFILLTDQVNQLSASCPGGNVVAGYFSGEDLLVTGNSNHAEVFFGLVPDPASPTCAVDKAKTRQLLAPLLIHEFQHMISYNRHVLLAGSTAEDTWLNEGLSQFAEELGGRQVASAWCVGGNCVNQFIKNNITNAYNFLLAPELYYLVEPAESQGTLQERGANWLFVRWLAEQAAGDSSKGRAVTRRLVAADNAGGIAIKGTANVTAMADAEIARGISFAQLLAEWQAANYVESRADIPAIGRLRYRSWNLPSVFDQLVLGPYPLHPDSIAGSYHGVGTLRGGTGRVVRLTRSAGSPPIAVGVTATNPTAPHLYAVRIK